MKSYIFKIYDFIHTYKIILSHFQFKFSNSNSYLSCICSLNIMQTSLASASLEKKKIVANLFFPGVIDPRTNKYNRIVKTWTCSACPSRNDPIWADLSHGYHNLINHTQSKHGIQWAEKYEEYKNISRWAPSLFFDKVSDKAKYAYNIIYTKNVKLSVELHSSTFCNKYHALLHTGLKWCQDQQIPTWTFRM